MTVLLHPAFAGKLSNITFELNHYLGLIILQKQGDAPSHVQLESVIGRGCGAELFTQPLIATANPQKRGDGMRLVWHRGRSGREIEVMVMADFIQWRYPSALAKMCLCLPRRVTPGTNKPGWVKLTASRNSQAGLVVTQGLVAYRIEVIKIFSFGDASHDSRRDKVLR